MKLKNIIGLLIVGSMVLQPLSMSADNGENDEDKNEEEDNKPRDKSWRPKSPSRKDIVMSVEGGALSIEFRKPEGNARIEILDLMTGISLSSEFDTAIGFRYALPLTRTSYKVTIRTDYGNVYVRNFDL